MRKFAVLFVFALLCAIPSIAQNDFKVSGGFTHMTGDPGHNGWYANGAYDLTPMFAVEGDIAGYYAKRDGATSNIHTFLIGPKIQATRGQFRPFGHFLFGVGHLGGNHLAGTSDFTWLIGGGGDLQMNEKFGARVFADLVRVAWYNSDDADTHARVGVGLVYTFGK